VGDPWLADVQVYVALSRARSMEGLQVLNLDNSAIMTDNLARNFYDRCAYYHGGAEVWVLTQPFAPS